MRYESIPGKGIATPPLISRLINYEGVKHTGDIQKLRKNLIILIVLKLILSFIYFGIKIYHLVEYTRFAAHDRDSSVTGALITGVTAASISIIYLIVFLIFIIKYDRLGILIFAWLTIIDLVFVVIVVIFAITVLISATSETPTIGFGLAISVFIVIIAALSSMITFLTIVFSFQMANLIKLQRGYQRT